MYVYFNYSQMQKIYFLYAIYFLYNAVKSLNCEKFMENISFNHQHSQIVEKSSLTIGNKKS